MGWDGDHAQREIQPGAAGVLVSDVVVLVGSLHHRRRSLQELGVALVAVGVFEEDAVAAAHRELAVAKDVIGETDAGRGIE